MFFLLRWNMSEERSSGGGGIGATGVAVIVLVTLKLAGVAPVAGWSWAAVIFMPMLIGLGVWIAIFGIVFGLISVFSGGKSMSGWWGRRNIRKMMDAVDAEDS